MENLRNTRGVKRKVLVVEDEYINREILSNILSREYDVHQAENGQDALEKLHSKDNNYSLILLDLIMPKMDGYEFLTVIREQEALNRIPIIVMTSEKDAEVKSIKLGAADFIPKPYDLPEVILARCERIIELSEGKKIIRSAEKDHLTDLYTKDFFFEYIKQIELLNARREVDAITLNIDHFHLVNELYGRKAGDQVLKMIAGILFGVLRTSEGIGCRSEADTFYIYCDHQDSYEEMTDQIQKELSELTHMPRVRLRIGVYQKVDKMVDAETWFGRAKLACDLIRGDFTRQISYYNDELHERAIFNERLIHDMEEAIRDKNLTVYYQPKYDVQGEEPRLKSAEALVRWKHPELGLINPSDFVPLFERNGLIRKLDSYVWAEAAAQVKSWRDEYGVTLPVSVNVSRIDIYDPLIEQKLLELLDEYELSPKDLLLEITESAYAENAKRLESVVESLREKGFVIELDDFGSGYSSLNMLTEISIDVLKMDMQFIRNMHIDQKSLKLVELIIDIAKYLKIPVVAEGVEEKSQVELLKKLGCEIIQGYYFSEPVPAEQFGAFIEKEKRESL